MIKGLWNYAVKSEDIEKVAGFYVDCMGALLMFRSEVYGCKYILLRLGSTRVIIFDQAPYEKELGLDLPPGFLHSVFEVEDFEQDCQKLRRLRAKCLIEPRVLEGEFGSRKLAFYQSPDGTRFEVMQILADSGKAG